MKAITLKNKNIPGKSGPFIIAEAGVNYYDIAEKEKISALEAAKLMVREAASAGADAIKFQIYKAEKLASKYSTAYWDITKEKTTSQFELFKKFDKLTDKDYSEIAKCAKKNNIIFMATPFDEAAVDIVDRLSPVFKVASADITNFPLLKKIAIKSKPVFLSVGASTIREIKGAVKIITEEKNNQIVLLHCVLNYPTEYSRAGLFRIKILKKLFPEYIIGYSDHTMPDEKMLVLTSAYLFGAEVIEKHFTLDKSLIGNDHYHAMDPDDLKIFVDNIKFLRQIIGNSNISEKGYLRNEVLAIRHARRSIVAAVAIKTGEKISEDKILIKRPGTGISPEFLDQIIGKKIKKDIKEDQILKWEYFS
jgi:N-acetylneuraminate synthase